jgi:peptidoglycan/LPS O-acetylase OafA/YrhL
MTFSNFSHGDNKAMSAGFRPDIEGLRAIAILLIVGYHADIPGFSGGYVGVDVFFVLSGFLITGLIVREIEKTGTLDLLGFYARRARRLLPALMLTLLVITILGVVIYAPGEQIEFSKTAIATAAYGSNLFFAITGSDYFRAERTRNPLLHTWSLSVEEQFYLVWPLFIMFVLNVLPWKIYAKASRRQLLWWMAAVAGLSFALSLYLTGLQQSWAYFLSPTRAWEFALGAIVVLLSQKPLSFVTLAGQGTTNGCMRFLPSIVEKSSYWSGWVGLIGICISSILFSKTTVFPGTAALLPAFSTALVLFTSSGCTEGSMVRILSL